MNMEYWWNDKLQGKKNKYARKKPPKCHFLYQKSYVDYPGIQSETSVVRSQKLAAYVISQCNYISLVFFVNSVIK
jgi:hypothetical protein